MMSDILSLNHHFAIPGVLSFEEGAGGLAIARIQNAHASAEIALQGAHLLKYQPANEEPVVWLSPQAKFVAGKSVRGGVPVCWPWFGAHATEPDFPAHGFARTQEWRVIASDALADGSTRIVFELQKNETARNQWKNICHLRNVITIGKTLTMELQTENTGSHTFVIGEALHTYFLIGDINEVKVTGLEGCDYLDKVEDFKRKHQDGAITVSSEVDRVYLNTTNDCVIHDAKLNRRIRIAKSGSQTTVVWNPWAVKSAEMGDMGDDGYKHMICVESANSAENVVTVNPGETHTLKVVYSIEH
jgi:D-hexose-6-phosphate mutarotase